MDTSGLATSLSLAASFLVFAYLSLAVSALSPANGPSLTKDRLSRMVLALQFLRLASVVAAVFSVQSLMLGQGRPGVALITIVALGLLALLVIIDRGTKLLAALYPTAVSRLTSPVKAPLIVLFNSSRPRDAPYTEVSTTNGKESGGQSLQPHGFASVVITEEAQAGLDARERLMIRSILRLDESTAREVMVPRVDIVAVEADIPLTEVANRMLECGHSRLPVYRETIDHIIGVVYSRDLLPFLGKTEEYPSLEKSLRPAFFIPESKRLDELLRELQEKRVQMAIVVDEYGGIEGLVTFEDLLEEIVGEIEDEFSRSVEPRVVPLADGNVIVDAQVTLDYISELYSTAIGNDDVDTVGGLVYSALGKMPQVGDEVTSNGLRIEVVSLLGRRIRKLKVSRTETQEPG